jgi:hypothetical protein
MKKRDVLRNMLLGWGLVGLTVVFTLLSLVYIQFFRYLPR